jgi:hypothetical protein
MDTDEGIAGAAWVGDGGAVAGLIRRRLTTLVGEDPLLTEKLSRRSWEIDRIKEMQMPHLGLIDLLARNIHAQSRSAARFLARPIAFNSPRRTCGHVGRASQPLHAARGPMTGSAHRCVSSAMKGTRRNRPHSMVP